MIVLEYEKKFMGLVVFSSDMNFVEAPQTTLFMDKLNLRYKGLVIL